MGECPHRGMKRKPFPWHYCRIESDLPHAIWLCDETHKAGYEDCAVYQRARAEAQAEHDAGRPLCAVARRRGMTVTRKRLEEMGFTIWVWGPNSLGCEVEAFRRNQRIVVTGKYASADSAVRALLRFVKRLKAQL